MTLLEKMDKEKHHIITRRKIRPAPSKWTLIHVL